jgi:Fe-S cluster assembly protein SufD
MQTITVTTHQTIQLTTGGEYLIELTKPGAHAQVTGFFSLQDHQKLDLQLYVVHRAAHTSAQTVLKGVARDQSQLRFFGRIKIEPNCPNIQSFLEERILLLSDQARAEAVPELEILSDDVKCSHAASVSRIPPEHLFYLMSRGLSRTAAEEAIIEGFLEPHKQALLIHTSFQPFFR